MSPVASKDNRRRQPKILCDADAAYELRDRLLTEMKEIACADDAALWAYCNLKAKNSLIAADAERVESAFQATLANLNPPVDESERPLRSHDTKRSGRNNRQKSTVIDKSVLEFPEPRRVRDRDHLRYVAKQACLICGRRPSDAHHLRFVQRSALGRKASDEFTVPLCRGHHREVHRQGDETAWWNNARIDPMPAARALWLKTHPLPVNSDKDAAVIGRITVASVSID